MIQSTLMAALEAAFQAAVKAEVDSQLTEIRQHLALNVTNVLGVLATRIAAVEARAEGEQIDYATLAESLSDDQIRRIGRQAGQMIDWASAVDWAEALDYSEIVSAIDLEELAGEFDLSAIAAEIDLQESVHEFFRNNQVTISV